MQKKTKHYQFNFWPKTEAEKDIDLISITQEKAYKEITSFTGDYNLPIIHYYFYPDRHAKGELTGNDGNGHADPDNFEVHAVYNKEIKCIGPHEDTHLLTAHLGLPPQLFREGLAEYLSKTWHGKPHSYWAEKFRKESKIYLITKLINDDFWYETDDIVSYPEAGAFIGFLISKIGRLKFLELYGELNRGKNSQENEKLISTITGKTLQDWENDWLSEL